MRTFARLAQELPAYDDLATKFDEPPLSLKKPLCLVYTGLLEFLQSVINVFIKKDGSRYFNAEFRKYRLFKRFLGLKHKLRVIADISWKPYDIRFQELLEDLEFYSTLVKTELQLLTYQDVKDSHAILKSNVKALGLEEADEMETKERGFRVLLESLRDSVARLEHSIAQRQWDDKCADHHRGSYSPSTTILPSSKFTSCHDTRTQRLAWSSTVCTGLRRSPRP